MKFIILVSNSKEISPSVFSWKKKEYIKEYDAILLLKYDSAEKKILNYAYMLKNGVDRYNIFFWFLHKAESSFLCHFRIESVNVLFNSTIRFSVPCASSSTINFAHAQTLSRMNSLSCRMNMRGSTLNSLRDVRKSNNDVFPSF